ncbi:hypothetical protein BJX61DRAFT_489788 [Aspergillus egyptiacus]|nr:hypothetical protein BJX61DRAFT_489788 [Aspergillus egyptiacus]
MLGSISTTRSIFPPNSIGKNLRARCNSPGPVIRNISSRLLCRSLLNSTETVSTVTAVWYIIRMIQTTPTLFPLSNVVDKARIDRYDLPHRWKRLSFSGNKLPLGRRSVMLHSYQCLIVQLRPQPLRPRSKPPPTTEELFGR